MSLFFTEDGLEGTLRCQNAAKLGAVCPCGISAAARLNV